MMLRNILILMLLFCAPLAAQQPARFAFQSGQAVYVAAYRSSGPRDLLIEERLQKAFEKQNVFKLARKVSAADFVFLAYSEYSGEVVQRLVCFALLPAQYEQSLGNHDALREAALWTEQSKNGWNQQPEPLSGRLVKAFHEQLASQLKTLAAKPAAPSPSATTEPKPNAQPDALPSGKALYLAPYRLSGPPESGAESRLQKVFDQQGLFKIARKLSEADYVLLVYYDYAQGYVESASGFLLTPEQYAQAKDNLDMLHEIALWQDRQRIGALRSDPERLSPKLAQKLHDDWRNGLVRLTPPAPAPAPVASPLAADAGAPAATPPAPTAPPAPSAPVNETPKPSTPNVPRDLNEARRFDEEAGRAYDKGQFDKAMALAQGALAFKEKLFGAQHVELVATLSQLARPLLARQDYQQAEALLTRALSIAEKEYGAEHQQTATLLSRLAAVPAERGELARALALQQRATTLLEKTLGAENAQLAVPLNDLALLELATGAHAQAEARLKRALALQEKALGKDARELAGTLHNLATVYFAQDDHARAQPLYERALSIFDGKQRGWNKFLNGVDRVANYGRRIPDQPALGELIFENRSIYVTDTLNNLAVIYLQQNRLKEAAGLLWRALAIERKAYGPHHPDVARTQDNLTLLYRAQGETWRALESQQHADEIVETNLRRNLVAGSERQKQAYVARFAAQTDLTLSLHLQTMPNEPLAAKAALNALLRHKGRGLDAMTDVLAQLRRNPEPAVQALLDQYAETRTQLAALQLGSYTPGDTEAQRAQVQQLEAELERLESAMAERATALRVQLRAITVEAVQTQLPPDSALVEFALYRPYDPKLRTNRAAHYAAYVLPAKGQPRALDLGEALAIDRTLEAWRKALHDAGNAEVNQLARALDELTMRPVRKLLGATRRVLLAPDGALNLIPFAALVDEEGRYLVEQYSFSYLTSGRDLLRLADRAASQAEPLLLADPDFGEAIAGQASARPATGLGALFAEAVFTPLPGTAEEGQALKTMLPQATLRVRAEATETALKQTNAPRLLHIATHGFFLAPAPDSGADTRGLRLKLSAPDAGSIGLAAAATDNPLLRSGLGLAGANARKGGAAGADDDGILTAFEAAALNLWGTKLVVLSACDTGVGEVKNGEGVYGLRRALVLAGSETQVMSLWPVSDRGTRDLMIAYYQRLLHGEARGEALRQVQLQMLAQQVGAEASANRLLVKKALPDVAPEPAVATEQKTARDYSHPYYWASFIQSGEWRKLD